MRTGRRPAGRRRGRLRPLRLALTGLLVVTAGAGCTLLAADAEPDGPTPVRPELPVPAAPEPAAGVPVLRPVDGGRDFYDRFTPALRTDDHFFPVGVWFESVLDVEDVQRDRAAGINLYVELTEDSDLDLVRSAGMTAILGQPRGGVETVGWLVSDEADMWGGPGSGAWTGHYPGQGEICLDPGERCGFTIQESNLRDLPGDARLRFANYGKGVTFWWDDATAARFVNEFQDVVSADNYWFTDEYICGPTEGGVLVGADVRLDPEDCHLAANYGRTVDRVRGLVQPAGSKPVWGFVELGHPSSEENWPTITPAEVRGAVWSSLIHGARGIIYFNHSFGGGCQSQHVLREPCYAATRETVTRLNHQIARLAPVLNAPFADGVTTVAGAVDTMTRLYDGRLYIVAGSAQPGPQAAAFRLSCVDDATVTVLDEDRTVELTSGSFTDEFADGNAVHVYRIDGPDTCGLG
jgi:hypothetical protein